MSNQQSSSYSSYTSSSYTSYSTSSSSSSGGGEPQTHSQSYSERANYDSRDGGFVERTSAETGKPTLVDRTEIPAGGGRSLESSGQQGTTQGRIEDVSDDKDQAARDQQYLDRMEDEYAKREGGA